jgi:hypothetical protein
MRIGVRDNSRGMILQQSKRGIQQLDSIIFLIKLYIVSDNKFLFDMIKQLIGFRLFIVSSHDASMNLCIQIISTIQSSRM